MTYIEITQIRTNIRPDLLPLDHVAAVLGVSAHRPGAGALVVVFAGLFGVEGEALDGAVKDRGGVHGGGV